MTTVTYQVVEHDRGWACKVGDVFSEPFATREEARRAAEQAASEQRASGETTSIQYEDAAGSWPDEIADGSDRPSTDVI